MSFVPPDHYDNAIAKRYLEQLADTPSLQIESTLPTADADDYLLALETIVKADMAERWQKLSFAGPVEIEQATFAKPPSVETYIARFPELLAADVLGRIAKWELSLRQQIGDRPLAAEYSGRFPQLGDQFDWSDGLASASDGGDDRRVGTTVGTYRIDTRIGEGNRTVSYRATQFRPVRKNVVVKFVKDAVDSAEVLNRFRFELSSLKNMDHPNVANAVDAAATATGNTYFVMPLVDGLEITDYAIENSLPIRDRIELFIKVCEVIQQAHFKGVIHRDLKPSNVLVSESGGRPEPMVLDFGIARAIGDRLGEQTVAAHFGQDVTSPQYISPEQASFNPSDIDTRSDVYSLGVILYEMLAGQPPFSDADLSSKAIDQTLRIIRQVVPVAPSERALGLSCELDWIVLHALEKDRDSRYQSPSELADDLRRFLSGEPVTVALPSWMYQVRKFARRSPFKFSIALLLLGLFVLAMVQGVLRR
ncbi:MAG: serine/threonine-protein kinase [Pirellulaceae bacterium]